MNNKERKTKDEVIVGNTTFKFELNQVSENVYDLVVTPCNVPTSIYCVARITIRENCCNNMDRISFENFCVIVIQKHIIKNGFY